MMCSRGLNYYQIISNQFHESESFLRSWQSLSWSKTLLLWSRKIYSRVYNSSPLGHIVRQL